MSVTVRGARKAVIYLDQNLVSNITKVLDQDCARREKVLRESFWLDSYKRLDWLLKLQLIVCPDSLYRRIESILSRDPDFESLQAVYTYLSNGCRFPDASAILEKQLLLHFRYLLEGHPDKEPEISVEEIVSGDLCQWSVPSIVAAIHCRPHPSEVVALLSNRKAQGKRLLQAFLLWQSDDTSFGRTVEEEAQEFARASLAEVFQGITTHILNALRVGSPVSPLELLPSPATRLVSNMFEVLGEFKSVDSTDYPKTMAAYLRSTNLLRIPFIRLSSTLYAALTRKVRSGMRRPPGPGLFVDVLGIASLLPYCQAMFLDNQMAGFLQEAPLCEEVKRYGTQIYSMNTRKDFLDFLDRLEVHAGPLHRGLIEDHYGSDWLDPYLDVLTDGKEIRRWLGRQRR